jgi:hypothetical protein
VLANVAPPVLYGNAKPRIAPPVPVHSDVDRLCSTAQGMGIELMPWQETAARYLTATNGDGLPLYREVCIVVARQNGKTHLMKPLIVQALRDGRRVMHIAQTRELPRIMFGIIASSLTEDLFLKERGRGGKMHTIWPRKGSGQEEILLANGGSYRIAAASSGGSRGFTNDLVIIDELREMDSMEIIAAVESTTATSEYAQLVYLSNAGTENSVVLNEVRGRADQDPSLAYLEWSAAPERLPDDRDGWVEANPALGHVPATLRSLENFYRRHSLAGSLAHFETENLCRWVNTLREPLVMVDAWTAAEEAVLGDVFRPVMAISMDPSGTRASGVLAWQRPNGTIALRQIFDVTGNPISEPKLGKLLREKAREFGVTLTGFDPWTDAALAKYLRRNAPIGGREYANASAAFVTAVEGGRLKWADCEAVGADLEWTARKPHDETGSFQAVRADDDRPITAALAAIRAVWLASAPRPESTSPTPRPRRSTVGF